LDACGAGRAALNVSGVHLWEPAFPSADIPTVQVLKNARVVLAGHANCAPLYASSLS